MIAQDLIPRTPTEDLKYLQDTLYVINGKWKLLILCSLCHGNRRFRDIQRSIPKITTRMLSKELRELEMNKLIRRDVHADIPVRIEYSTTDYCKLLAPVIQDMINWGREHHHVIKEI